MEIITSTSNQVAKYVRSLSTKRARDTSGTFVAEGAKFVEEVAACRAKSWEIELVAASDSFAKANNLAKYQAAKLHIMTDRVFASISDVKQPQGVLAVVRQKKYGLDEMLGAENPLLLLLEDIQDPGNLGTILRIAHGLGSHGIILSADCADIYSPKVVRSSAGSIFHVTFATAHLQETITALKSRGIRVFAAKSQARRNLHQQDFRRPTAFVVGNEARGLSDEIAAASDAAVSIPAKSESLNASVACGILVYEAMRQRSG
ncbi:MAG: RNA methyltransferase [Clostridiales bacterium]|jgi:TrmH family RNA methyltransferase|nr:RNA methyltransferase [Clostridiales bacterium]